MLCPTGHGRKRHVSGSGSDSGSDVVRNKKRRVFSDDEDGDKDGAASGDENMEGMLTGGGGKLGSWR